MAAASAVLALVAPLFLVMIAVEKKRRRLGYNLVTRSFLTTATSKCHHCRH